MPDAVLVLDRVVKTYGAALGVGPIDLQVEKGEFLSLLGPSGCGKTTTLHLIAGLLAPTEGRLLLAGRDITNVPPPRRDMGLVFQNYALFPHKTIFDNVAFGLRMRKVPRPQIQERVRRMLDLVGLPSVEARTPDQLSGGQRQRVALARALVIEPTILLLDEPLSNLDAVLRKRMRYELRELQRRLGITTIFVTHDQDEAFEMSDRVALLNNGLIEQLGAPEELYDMPASRFVAEFIGEVNLVEGRIMRANGVSADIEIANGIALPAKIGEKALKSGDHAYAMIRPERIDLSADKPQSGDAWEMRITKRTFSGEQVSFEVESTNGVKLLCIKPSLPRFRELRLGQTVWIMPQDCRALPRAT
jgi:ABC-type Fe3+/spermidine/putrescine transport system ATPase subunit